MEQDNFLMMACDLEYTLLNIMAFSAPDPLNQIRRFRKMFMSEKINNTIADLKHYKPNYYQEYQIHLDQLHDFREIRNDMAHYKMDFPNRNNLKEFRIIFIDEDEGIEGLMQKHYTWDFFIDSLQKFKKLNGVLAGLWMKLKVEYDLLQGEHPLVHPNSFPQP